MYKTNNSSLEKITKTNNKINGLFHSGKTRKIVSHRKESFELSTMIEVFQIGIFWYIGFAKQHRLASFAAWSVWPIALHVVDIFLLRKLFVVAFMLSLLLSSICSKSSVDNVDNFSPSALSSSSSFLSSSPSCPSLRACPWISTKYVSVCKSVRSHANNVGGVMHYLAS